MNWPFVGVAAIYGILCSLWAVGSSIYILPAMPDAFGWLKIASVAIVNFVGGVFLYCANPSGAWTRPPGGKP